jgi:hypothetical protein
LYNSGLVQRLTTSTARKLFAEVVNKAFYADQITVISRRGKDLAAVVPMSVVPDSTQPNGPGKKRPRGSFDAPKARAE